MEVDNAEKETNDQSGKVEEDVKSDPPRPLEERIEQVEAAVIEAAIDAVEEYAENGWVKRHRQEQARLEAFQQQEAEARGRDLLEPYTVKAHLINGQTVTFERVTVPWTDWLRALQEWRGIGLETGFTPLGAIAHIERIVKDAPVVGGNVVLFSEGKK